MQQEAKLSEGGEDLVGGQGWVWEGPGTQAGMEEFKSIGAQYQ